MIHELFFMNGYGAYVLSAFSFTLVSFSALYLITKIQFIKEQNKFVAKFGSLNSKKAKSATAGRDQYNLFVVFLNYHSLPQSFYLNYNYFHLL